MRNIAGLPGKLRVPDFPAVFGGTIGNRISNMEVGSAKISVQMLVAVGFVL